MIDFTNIETGRGKSATLFEKAVEEVFTFCYYPKYIDAPISQSTSINPDQRRDIILPVIDTSSFFHYMSIVYRGDLILIECKNYTEQMTQQEVEKTLKYLRRPSLANIGFLIVRNGYDKGAFESAIDAYRIDGRLLIFLTEKNLNEMIAIKSKGDDCIPYLRRTYQNQKLTM